MFMTQDEDQNRYLHSIKIDKNDKMKIIRSYQRDNGRIVALNIMKYQGITFNDDEILEILSYFQWDDVKIAALQTVLTKNNTLNLNNILKVFKEKSKIKEISKIINNLKEKLLKNHHDDDNLPKFNTSNEEINTNIFIKCNNIDDNCQICINNPRNSCILPCRHKNYCYSCVEKLKTCPKCGKDIDSILKSDI